MFAGLNQVGGDCCLSESLAGFEPMQSLYQNKAGAVRPHKNGRFLTFRQHALGQGCNLLRIQCLTPLHRHIDILDRDGLPLQHPLDCPSPVPLGSKLSCHQPKDKDTLLRAPLGEEPLGSEKG